MRRFKNGNGTAFCQETPCGVYSADKIIIEEIMATINDYIYENILMEEVKLNRLSNQLGKIILTIYNSVSKLDDSEKYEKLINILKEIRIEMLVVEKKIYNKSISEKEIRTNFNSFIKGLKKVKKEFEPLDDKKINRALDKLDKLIEKLSHIKITL